MCDMMSRYWRLTFTGPFMTPQEPLMRHYHGVSWPRYVNAKKRLHPVDQEMTIRGGAAVADVHFIQFILSLSLTIYPTNPPCQPPISISPPDPINQHDEVRCSSSILPRPPHPRSACGSSTPPPRSHVPKDHQPVGKVDWRQCL